MTLVCECGSYDLEITSQSYTDCSAFESYECQHCGRKGSLTYDETTGERLSGCVESDSV